MIDLIKGFKKHEKLISQYITDRKVAYERSKCKKFLLQHIERLDSSWNMEVPGDSGNSYQGQLCYALVKQIMLSKRALFTSNYRQDPVFTMSPIGMTPAASAEAMQQAVERNNQLTKFRHSFLIPNINKMIRWGTGVAYTEYDNVSEEGYKTTIDALGNVKREYGIVKRDDLIRTYDIDVRNYGQNPDIISAEESDINWHIERWKMSELEARYKANPEKYIKENVEKVIKSIKQKHFFQDKQYVDAQGRESMKDYGRYIPMDVTRGQAQIFITDNTDDATYYNFEMVGDIIVSFQDNPYDMGMKQHTVLACEHRIEYFWGDTPASYSIQNENTLNLLHGMSVENAIQSMDRRIFYNSNAIDPDSFDRTPFNGRIPVNVAKDVNLNNVLYQSQPQDTAGSEVAQAHAIVLENHQRTTTEPDLNRNPSQGGPSNKTATAAKIIDDLGANQDADILEQYSMDLTRVGEKIMNGIGQFVANTHPLIIPQENKQEVIEIHKNQLLGDYAAKVDTALQRSYLGDDVSIKNHITWLNNLVNSGVPVNPNWKYLTEKATKLSKVLDSEQVFLAEEPQQPGQPQLPSGIPGAPPQPGGSIL